MDDIHSKQQRYAQPALPYGDLLDGADLVHPLDVEESADLAFSDFFANIRAPRLSGDNVSGDRQVQLTKLFFKGHACHQRVDESVHARLCHGVQHQRACEHQCEQYRYFFQHVRVFWTRK